MKAMWLVAAVTVVSASPAFAEEAAANWKAKCKSCHGEDGKAQTKTGKKEKMTDISTAKWQEKHSDDAIRDVITNGDKKNKKMKPYKDKLSAEEIDGLVEYVRGLKQS